MRIDSHQHFWRYDPAQHVWMTPAMQSLRRDFLPQDLEPLLAAAAFDGTVAVQARQMIEETEWLLELADSHPFIRGVIGWVDLCSPRCSDQLRTFSGHKKFRGVRHVVHDEADDRFMLRPDFLRGLASLREFNLAYDLLLFPRHLPVACQVVAQFPEQLFVLDHIAKPRIAEQVLSPWREDLARLAAFPNVCCKLSGLVTEAAWGRWRPAEFHPYLDVVLNSFGPERLMIGSDWPVSTLSADYGATMRLVTDFLAQAAPASVEAILGGNCARSYNLPGCDSRC